MKLYKFRSLGDAESLCRAKEIIRTGKFWCSRFWEMNDPMEGVYSFKPSDDIDIQAIFNAKARFAICSFSGKKAFSRPPMWGYYANGFKGMAIEIEVPDGKVEEMQYKKDVVAWLRTHTEGSIPARAKRILSIKLMEWKHEDEFRYFWETDCAGGRKIGEIKRIHFGYPHRKTQNQKSILQESQALCTYLARQRELQELAEKEGIDCSFVTVRNGMVVHE